MSVTYLVCPRDLRAPSAASQLRPVHRGSAKDSDCCRDRLQSRLRPRHRDSPVHRRRLCRAEPSAFIALSQPHSYSSVLYLVLSRQDPSLLSLSPDLSANRPRRHQSYRRPPCCPRLRYCCHRRSSQTSNHPTPSSCPRRSWPRFQPFSIAAESSSSASYSTRGVVRSRGLR